MIERLKFLRRSAHLASVVTLFGAVVVASQQLPQGSQAAPVRQQDEAGGDADEGNEQGQQPPASVVIEGAVTVANQPNPNQEQRYAEQQAQIRFDHRIQLWTLILLAATAAGALGAFWANWRSARAAEKQVDILKGQVADARADATEQRGIAAAALAETRKSVDLADKHFRLLNRQWLTTKNWIVTRHPWYGNDSAETEILRLSCELFNPTHMAVELIDATVTARSDTALVSGSLADLMDVQTSITVLPVQHVVVPPGRSATLGNIIHAVGGPKHINALRDDKLGISGILSISYNDALGERQTQTLSCTGYVGRDTSNLAPSSSTFIAGRPLADDPKTDDNGQKDTDT